MTTLGPYELNSIVTGDARELSKAIPDNSVDLIFTDPVYDRIEDYEWLAETAARVLKDGGNLLCWQAVPHSLPTLNALDKYLLYRWTLAMTRSNVCKAGTFANFYSHWTPCYWFSKSIEAKPHKRFRDCIDIPYSSSENGNHKWHKPKKILTKYIEAFTQPNDIIFDPFTGGGTVPAVCKMLNRQYLAFEIDPVTADLARQRVANTQPPLPIVYPEQMELSCDHP
jgi:DNA modification methylase